MNKKKLSLLPIAAFAAMLCACSDSDGSSVSIEEWDPPISSSSEVKDEYSSEKEEAIKYLKTILTSYTKLYIIKNT